MRKLLLLNFLLISIFAAAQEKIPTCKTDEMQKQLLENNKEYKALYEQTTKNSEKTQPKRAKTSFIIRLSRLTIIIRQSPLKQMIRIFLILFVLNALFLVEGGSHKKSRESG